MVDRDPFDTPITNEDSPRGPGRPRTRQIREKGSVGRPRVRPINDPSSRRRGRPRITPGSIADSISTEAIVSGQMTVKAINTSIQGLQGAIGAFQKGVINPLSIQVTNFSQAIGRFNKSHQEYLREQVAVSKEIHETYRLIRKVGLDPLIRNTERTRLAISSVTDTMKKINSEKYQGKEYEQMISSLTSMDRKLNRMVTAGVVGTEATDTFLREYYRTSKGTSKFLNAVTFAAEDIAEDIQTLKNDLNKYFKGKNSSKTILQDNSESLKRIEKNTRGMGFVITSSILSGVAALAKTAFLFNRYGTTDVITQLTGLKKSKGASGLSQKAPLSKIFSSILGNEPPTKFQEASLGGYGDFAKNIAESFERTGRRISSGFDNLKGLGKSIADAWNESKTRWFWNVGLKMFADRWDRYGAIGVSIVSRVKKNYGRKNYTGPHGGNTRTYYGSQEDALSGVQRALDKYDRSKTKLSELGEWESENEAQVAFSPEYLRNYMNPKNRPINRDNVIDARRGFNRVKRNSQGKTDAVVDAAFGKGAKVISINPKSTTQISSADVSTPRKAWGSLTRIQGRILGILQRLEKHIKGIDKNTENLEDLEGKNKEGIFGKILGGLGLGGLGAFLLKNKNLLRGGKGKGLSLLGKLVFGSKAIGQGLFGKKLTGRMKGLGATTRVLWDTFGWGSSKNANGAMKALGIFKNTKLGKSFLGRGIRQARVAAAGYGTGLGSRLLRAFAHSRKWGGDILGNTIGAYKGFIAPARSIEGFARLANPTRGMSLLQKGGLLMDKAGAGIVSGFGKTKGLVEGAATRAGNWLGGIGKLPKANILTKIPSKDKFIGGLLGGAGAKLLGKTAGKGAAKALLKQVPILGAIVGIGFGIHRFIGGDVFGGILEIVSGLLTLVPSGLGNAAALGIDAFLVGRDIHKAKSRKKESLNEKKAKKKILGFFGVKENNSTREATPAPSTSLGSSPTPIKNTKPSNKTGILVGLKNAAKAGAASISKAVSATQETISGITSNSNSSKGIDWGGTDHSKMMPEFMEKFNAAADEFYRDTGIKVRVTSAIRNNKKQAELYVRGAHLHEDGVYKPAKPAMDEIIEYKGNTYYVKGRGQKTRTGHMAGGAVDVDNWAQFHPYATKHGLTWMGKEDPVHFQINKAGPVIGATSSITNPPPNAKVVGDGSNETSSVIPIGNTRSIGTNTPAQPNPSPSMEFSPMIQDYGLAIINNLLFT